MSIVKGIKEIILKHTSRPIKRRKTGLDEDEWCDALNDLSVDDRSSSGEEYFDALEDLNQNKRKRKKRNRKRSAKDNSSESSKMFHHHGPASRPEALVGKRRVDIADSSASGAKSGILHAQYKGSSRSSVSVYDCKERDVGSSRRRDSDPGWRTRNASPGQSNKFSDHTTQKRSATSFSSLPESVITFTGTNTSPRRITVTLMTSWQPYTIEGLKKKMQTFQQSRYDIIEEVKVLQLPYNGIQHYEFTEHVDVMILCHSIENRRFSITDVTDSLYDEFLAYCNKRLGKERIVVMAHDFPNENKRVTDTKMKSFRCNQPSTFELAGLVMICGSLEKEPEISEQNWNSLVKFLEAASGFDRNKAVTRPPRPPIPPRSKHHPSSTVSSKPQTSYSKKSVSSSPVTSPGNVRMATKSRQPVVYLCTSFGLHTVKGLKEDVQALLTRSFLHYDLREQEIPYSGLKDFRFPSEAGKMDAMILCHSVNNRGFSVTDVENSIYDDYLEYCMQLFGKHHIAVIVHDFDIPEMLEININAFRRGQPTTFTRATFVAVAGKLDVPNVQLCADRSKSLESFIKELR